METWRDVPGWEGLYQVSDAGRVRSCDRVMQTRNRFGRFDTRQWPGKILKQCQSKALGYTVYSFTAQGRKREYFLGHQLVMLAFVGPCPAGLQVCHGNGKRDDNRLENLRYGTPQDNSADRIRHGTNITARGEASGNAKLTDDAVRWARENYGKLTLREMGRRLGVTHGTVRNSIVGISWTHI